MPWGSDGYYTGSGDYDGDGRMGSGGGMAEYRRNKEAMGGRAINQANLDVAARIGALGRNSSGQVVRDAAAWDRATPEQMGFTQSSGDPRRDAVARAHAGQAQDYIDYIMGAAFDGAPVPQQRPQQQQPQHQPPAGKKAPTPAPEPTFRRKQTDQDRLRFELGLNNGYSLEAIMGGALGGGAAVIAYETWKAMNAHPASTGAPNNPTGNVGGAAPNNPRNGGGGTGTAVGQPNRRIVDGQWIDTNIIDGTFQELFNRGMLEYEPRLMTNSQGRTVEVPTMPRTNPRQVGYSGNINKSISPVDSSIQRSLEGYSDDDIDALVNDMRARGITDPGAYGITPTNAPSVFDRVVRTIGN